MADVKISGLPASTVPLAGTEVLPIVQSSTTKKVSIANVTAGRAVSALSFTPTGSALPTNGLFLPDTNAVGISTNSEERARFFATGGVSIGNSTDPGAGNLSVTGAIISAGAYSQFTSSGGGTSTTSVYVSSTGREPFVVTSSSATDTMMNLTNTGSGGTNWQIRSTANGSAYGGGALVFFSSTVKCILYSSGGLSLGNTTDKGAGSLNVSGLIYPQQAATASAPAYAKGAIYFDTTLNKLCVGGATAWETITSV